VILICVGMPGLVNEAFELARKGGRINVFAGLADEGWAEVAANLIHYNQLEVTGVTGARRSDYEVALRLIESDRVRVDGMVTHRFPLQDTVEALDTAAGSEGIKVAVMP
jgi:L-iditol 2-dehydrogenase